MFFIVQAITIAFSAWKGVYDLKRNDIFLLFVILAIAVSFFIGYRFLYYSSGDSVTVSVNGNVTHTLSLHKDSTLSIESTDGGINLLEIKDGAASITHANCPDRLCVHQKKIKNQGETLVCLPHKVIISVISDETSEMDGISH